MRGNLRKSGIDIIGEVPWGTHFCQFYQTKEDLIDILVPYFKAGLENNEFCMWVTSEPLEVEKAKEALGRAVPDIDVYLEKGQLGIISYIDWCMKDGVFNSEKVVNQWIEKIDQALANGYDGLRMTGNISWLKREDWKDFADYEAEGDRIIGNYRIVALCTYCLDRCNASEIIDVVTNHQFALIKKEGEWEQIESSKRKEIEKALRESREDLNRAQEVGNIGSWHMGLGKNELTWSDENYRIFGIPKSAPLSYETFLSKVHPDDREYVDEKWKEGMAGEPYDIEHRIIAEGKIKWVSEKAYIEFDKDGALLGSFGITQDITERKLAEEALRQSEQRVRLKLESILSPAGETANLELADIIDAGAIQSLMDDFYKFAYIPMALVDLKGNVLVGVGWQDICTEFHRVHPKTCKHCLESDTKLSAGVPPGEFKLYRCKNNMWDIATPVVVGGKHVGNLFSGQFFFEGETPDYELFRVQARKYGFNEEEYMAALEKVPRLSRETVDTSMAFLTKLAHMFSQLSYSNIKLARSLAERDALVDALRESEERFRSVLEHSLDAVYRRNLQTDIYDYMSPAIEQITGFSVREMSAMRINEVFNRIHPDDRPRVAAELVRAFDESHGTLEYRFRRKDGKYCWFADHFTVIKDQNDMPLFNGGIVRDITKHKQIEEALIRSENKFRTLAENSPDIISRFDRQNRHIYANPASAEPYSHSPEEIIGKTHTELGMSPNKVKFWEGHHEHVFTTGKPKAIEFQYTSPRGKEYHFNTRIVPEFVGGEVTSVLAISRDITDIKKAEARLKEAYENLEELVEERTIQLEKAYNSLKESEKGLAEAQKMAHIGNWEWDIASDKASWSEEMYRIFGRDPHELAPSYNEYLSYIHPDDRDYYCNATKKAVSGIPFDIDYRIVTDTGEERTVHMKSEFILNNRIVPIRIKGIVQDITERKKAEKTLANLETARKKEIHHRIKNNLQVISSLLDLQAEKFNNRECVEDSEVLKAFRESQNRVVSIALIHEELHEGEGNDTLNFSPYLKRLARNLFQTYKLGNADTRLNVDLEENIFFDMDTAVPLGIIINELVSNSLKHAFQGRDKGAIRIKLCREENAGCANKKGRANNSGCVNNSECTNNIRGSKKEGSKGTNFILTVSDNGVGMPENFNPENSDTLGIQLVSILAGQLDGELELKRDAGTEFIIRFAVEEQ